MPRRNRNARCSDTIGTRQKGRHKQHKGTGGGRSSRRTT